MNFFTLFISIFFCCNVFSQKIVTTAGGEATGQGWSLSYTYGQVVYETKTNNNEIINEGVQQPYFIDPTIGIDEAKINLNCRAYPNPTINKLYIEILNFKLIGSQYIMYNLQYQIVLKGKINSSVTVLKMLNFSNSIYLLNIYKDQKIIKSYKIIKN